MIWNVIDRRTNHHKWKLVDVCVEPVWHDNTVKGADKAPKFPHESDYEDLHKTQLPWAIQWADSLSFPVTLYIYDPGALKIRHTLKPNKKK